MLYGGSGDNTNFLRAMRGIFSISLTVTAHNIQQDSAPEVCVQFRQVCLTEAPREFTETTEPPQRPDAHMFADLL